MSTLTREQAFQVLNDLIERNIPGMPEALEAKQALCVLHQECKLDAPAAVGGVRFQKGIKWSTVIAAAQRHHGYVTSPERETERIARARSLQEMLGMAAQSPTGRSQPMLDLDFSALEARIASQDPQATPILHALGGYLFGTKKDANGLRVVLRQHRDGFSKTVFDTTVHPFRTLSHEEFKTVPVE